MTLGTAGNTSIYINDGGTWREFLDYEYFKIVKKQNQVNSFEIKIMDLEATEKAYVKEFAEVLFFSEVDKIILKGRIQKIKYATAYECLITGYGMEATLLDKEFIKENESGSLDKRIQYTNKSAKSIAMDLLSTQYNRKTFETYAYANIDSFAGQTGSGVRFAQTFTVGNVGDNEEFVLSFIELQMVRVGAGWTAGDEAQPGIVHCELKAVDGTGKPTGDVLSFGSINGNELPRYTTDSPYDSTKIPMSAFLCQPSTEYALIVYCNTATSQDMFGVGLDTSSPTYAGGKYVTSADGGSSWTVVPSTDLTFFIYGGEVIMTPASTGLFAIDWGDVSIRYEYANRLNALGKLSEAIDYDWWISQNSTYDDFFHIENIRGDQTHPNLVGHWKMNDNLATTNVIDTFGNFNGTTTANTNTLSATGKINTSLNFNDDDHANIGPIDASGYSGLTLSAWVYLDGLATYHSIFDNEDFSSPDFDGWLFRIQSDGTISFALSDALTGGGVGKTTIQTTATITTGIWAHLTATWDGTNMKIYINNVEKASGIWAGTIINHGQNAGIGGFRGSDNFVGSIDDVRMYNKAISADERASIYNSGSGTEGETTQIFNIEGSGANCYLTSREKDISNLANKIDFLGYGDGKNQIHTSTYNASPINSTLSADITSSDTTISLVDASDFAGTGTIRIMEEIITYGGKSNNDLTGCTRGTSSTTALAHKKDVYVEKSIDINSAEANSSINDNGLIDYTIINKQILDLETAELIVSKNLLEKMNAIVRITIIPNEPLEVAGVRDIGDLITITDSEADTSEDSRIVGMIYISNYGDLSLEIEASNKSLTFIEQMQKQKESSDNLSKYMQGATNLFWFGNEDNCNASYPLVLKFFIPEDVVAINKVLVRFSRPAFRGYNTTAGGSINSPYGSYLLHYGSVDRDTSGSNLVISLFDSINSTGTFQSHTAMGTIHNLSGASHKYRMYITVDDAIYAREAGTAESGGANTLTDTDKTWTVNEWSDSDRLVTIISGTGSGQIRAISSNTSDTLTVASNWGVNPSSDSIYVIFGAEVTLPDGSGYRVALPLPSSEDKRGSTWKWNFVDATGESNSIWQGDVVDFSVLTNVLNFDIYTPTLESNVDVTIKVDGTDVRTETAVAVDDLGREVDVTVNVSGTGWHTITITPTGTARLSVTGYVKCFVESK